ncbi:MAG TPA: hypothetical protein PKW33_05440 [Anaerolineaceae bacterium]|nr:hypothetical protein [Anaerolineaceae bacterium]HPN51009.1 hypothetical protein [Anaerolineaceae bacterium]
MSDDHYYPEWLGQKLVAEDFPWHEGQSISLPAFLSRYPVHDSPWIGYWTGSQSTVIVLRWDTCWCSDRVPFPGSQVAEWPILLINFSQVYQFMTVCRLWEEDFELGEVIESAESRHLDPVEREALLAASLGLPFLPDGCREAYLDNMLHYSVFNGVYRKQFHILHSGETSVLCLNRAGEILAIPGLEGEG